MVIQLYNTLTNSKADFTPVEPGKVKFYVCGPTVYDYIHIGNGRAFVAFDVLRRFLKSQGYEVLYVMNLTDIDDRIIERSIKEGVPTEEITEKYTQAFFEDLDALGILRADIYPKATEHVEEIISLIRKLMDEGFAYEVEGDVFYDVNKFKDYGKLSGKKLEDLIAGSRVEIDERKHNPFDFALWKAQKPGEPAWESPWGMGRPGWHIECSAMSMKYLGQNFDIHAGGIDLVFPHHENEIAQSEAVSGEQLANNWLHNGFLQIDGAKMAKSLGNFKRVRDIVKIYPGAIIRLFFLQKHYRSPIDFTQEGLEAAKTASARLRTFYQNLCNAIEDLNIEAPDQTKLADHASRARDHVDVLRTRALEALADDLDTPAAVSCLFDLVRETNKVLSKATFSAEEKVLLRRTKNLFDELESIFGITKESESGEESQLVDRLISILIDVREQLRVNKDWELSDKIRDELQKNGVVLEDKTGKTTWRLK